MSLAESQLQRLEPVYFLGDSHTMMFNHLLLALPDLPPLLTRAIYIPQLKAFHFCSEAGELHPEIVTALQYEGLLRRKQVKQVGEQREVGEVNIEQLLKRPSPYPPRVVICCGYGDLFLSMCHLGDHYGFVLPGFEAQFSLAGRQLLPLQAVQNLAAEAFKSLELGLQQLQKLGLQLFLHELPPPMPSDQDFYHQARFHCPWDTRLQLTLVFNQQLQALAERLQIPFVSIWQQITTAEQQLQLDYHLDGVHLNRHAARLSLQALLAAPGFREACAPAPLSAEFHFEHLRDLAVQMESLLRQQAYGRMQQVFAAWQAQLPPIPQLLNAPATELSLCCQVLVSQLRAQMACQQWSGVQQVLTTFLPLLYQQMVSEQPPHPQPMPALLWLADSEAAAAVLPTGYNTALIALRLLQVPLLPPQAQALQQRWQAANPGYQLSFLPLEAQQQPDLNRLRNCQCLGWSSPLHPSQFDLLLTLLVLWSEQQKIHWPVDAL